MRILIFISLIILLFTTQCCTVAEKENAKEDDKEVVVKEEVKEVEDTGRNWYWTIGFFMTGVFTVAWLFLFLTLKTQILAYLRKEKIFLNDVTESYFDYRANARVSRKGTIDNTIPAVLIGSGVGLILSLFLYPIIIGVCVFAFLYYKYIREDDKLDRIIEIINE